MPTSITLVIFALTANVSIANLLLAGLIPGIITGLMLCVYSYFYALRRGMEVGSGFLHPPAGARDRKGDRSRPSRRPL